MILANEQVAGYLADRKLPALYRVHEKPDPQAVEAMVAQLASLDIPTPALPRNMSPQQAADVAAEASRLAAAEVAPQRPRAVRRSARWCCARSSRPTTRRATSATPAWRARATATSPRRSAATPTWWCTARCSAASGSTPPRRARTSWTRPGIEASAREREAMKIERAADDVCLAFLLERTLSERRRDPPVVRGRDRGPDRQGRVRALRRGGLRGLPAGAPPARLVRRSTRRAPR